MNATYKVTIDVGTKNERQTEMTLAEYRAHIDQRSAEAMAIFIADASSVRKAA
jgi:hypothetical protein